MWYIIGGIFGLLSVFLLSFVLYIFRKLRRFADESSRAYDANKENIHFLTEDVKTEIDKLYKIALRLCKRPATNEEVIKALGILVGDYLPRSFVRTPSIRGTCFEEGIRQVIIIDIQGANYVSDFFVLYFSNEELQTIERWVSYEKILTFLEDRETQICKILTKRR